MEKQWISTIELLNYLKEHPDKEKECRLNLGYGLGSTHYWYWAPRQTCSCTPATGILSLIPQVKWLNGTGKANGRLNNELRVGVNE